MKILIALFTALSFVACGPQRVPHYSEAGPSTPSPAPDGSGNNGLGYGTPTSEGGDDSDGSELPPLNSDDAGLSGLAN